MTKIAELFLSELAEANESLNMIQEAVEGNFNVNLDNVNWANVGDVRRLASELAEIAKRLERKSMVSLVEKVASGEIENPVILFLWKHHQISIGDDKYFLTGERWERAHRRAAELWREGLLVTSPCQGGFAYKRVGKADSELSCLEWLEKYNRRCQPKSVCPICPPPAIRRMQYE